MTGSLLSAHVTHTDVVFVMDLLANMRSLNRLTNVLAVSAHCVHNATVYAASGLEDTISSSKLGLRSYMTTNVRFKLLGFTLIVHKGLDKAFTCSLCKKYYRSGHRNQFFTIEGSSYISANRCTQCFNITFWWGLLIIPSAHVVIDEI